eukprot:CAMPEP_0197322888 /NCGR_PEP_ID=MMETSP0891-20130614/70176_1 /TAXON_ID=44058 ORGANISM="Aureoumbra lagunensis, Strain CCMP1510" /NCGR_SAMPLE_ID=MMETSP0891 /ASSEMBLY_ACC=CAM_ASM_000534 /LENGTH=1392 /DNA_ID=CAMNT_0042815401 /DNA_START=114 /DNA_END=4293 /DNA_ORIENTATION=-
MYSPFFSIKKVLSLGKLFSLVWSESSATAAQEEEKRVVDRLATLNNSKITVDWRGGVDHRRRLDDHPWTVETAKLLPTDDGFGAVGDWFGTSVALYETRIVVGAPYDDDLGTWSGSAYVFDYSSAAGSWSQIAKLVASDGAADVGFGTSVALYETRIVVGAYGDDDKAGSAYVFDYSSAAGSWSHTAKLVASDGGTKDYFGFVVALYETRIVVGAYGDDDKAGSAYVFDYSTAAGSWSQTAKLVASDGAAGDEFGISVALYETRIVVGAYYDDELGSNSGSAYVFDYSSAAGSWFQTAKLWASDGWDGDWFGNSVALYETRIVVGAHFDDDLGENSGSAYVFDYSSAAGSWSQTAKLVASDGAADDWFGRSVAIYETRIVVGAHGDDEVDRESGSAYVFDAPALSTLQPTPKPTSMPTYKPTTRPSKSPTLEPTQRPTSKPTYEPSFHPTSRPTSKPTSGPTHKPTLEPTFTPTVKTTPRPTPKPTSAPTDEPTPGPTPRPTIIPTSTPTFKPSPLPTSKPTPKPTSAPTDEPTPGPTTRPTSNPTTKPSPLPTLCQNDPTWYKNGDSLKDCVWVSAFLPNRCEVRGADGREASEACFNACGCTIPTIKPTFSPTTRPTFHPTQKPTATLTIPGCTNDIRDGTETDIDCGGSLCSACASGLSCSIDSDCKHNSVCIDCGGSLCKACASGLSCSIDSDCITQFCLVDICVAAPTSKPTSNPTSNPTSHPTLKPTSCPTIKPALFPTSRVSTSSYPTLKPTSCPTIKPTFFPTSRVPTATGGSSSGSSIGGGDSTPIIIGAAGGGLLILLLLTLCLCCYYVRRESPSKAKRRAKRTRPDDDDEISPQISSQQQQPQKQPSESAAAARANARVMVNALLTGASMLPGIFNVSWAILAVLDEVDSMNAKAQDIVAAGQRVCDTAEFLTILNENAAGFKSDNAKVLVERYMDQLESLLKRFQDGVASFKGKGWLSRKWHNLAHTALLQKLDRDIIEVLEKLRQAYHLAMDRHVTELLSKKTYNLEAAMQQQIQLLVSKQHVTPEAAAEQLANDENVLTVVASRAGVAESDVSAERLRIREDKLKLLKAHELTLDSIEKEPFARGGQAQVHKGTFTDKVVAVKLVPLRSLSDQEIERLKSSLATEVAICTKLSRSPFIVQVYGVVNVDRNFFGMVMEYMHRGSLRTRLDDIGNYPTISEKQRLWWCRQIAAGIQFLYTNGVSHRDLKSSNVLLASRDSCKITDFGLARSEEFRTHTTQLTMRSGGVPAGTYGFMAPELLQNNEFTEKSDVYSYAMVCFEIVTRERPWRGLSLPQIMKYVADEGKRPELPLHVSAILISLIEICWKQDPNDRPTFASINQNFFPRSLSSGSSSFGSISDVDTPSFDNDSTSSMTRRSTT